MSIDPGSVIEPIGKVIILVRDYLSDHGNLMAQGGLDYRDIPVRGTEKEKDDEPPYVLIERGPVSDFPFGQGSGRIGVADHTFFVRSYGRKHVKGEREASQLARLVSRAVHNHVPTVMAGVGIYRIRTVSTGQPLRDPITEQPYVPMVIGLYAASLEVAS